MKLQSKIKDALYVQSEKAWHFDSGNQQRECACWCPTWSVDDQPANWICVSSLDGLLVLILGCIAAHTHDTHIDINQYPKKRKEKIINPMHNCCVILVCLFVVSCCFFKFYFTSLELPLNLTVASVWWVPGATVGHVQRQSTYEKINQAGKLNHRSHR